MTGLLHFLHLKERVRAGLILMGVVCPVGLRPGVAQLYMAQGELASGGTGRLRRIPRPTPAPPMADYFSMSVTHLSEIFGAYSKMMALSSD